MTETTQQAPATRPGPQFRFGGTFAVYLTPAGGLHVTYQRRTQTDDDTGVIEQVAEPYDEHLPEIPPAFVDMLAKAQVDGRPPSPMAILKAMMDGG